MTVRQSLQTRNVVTDESTLSKISYTSNRPVAFMVKNTECLDLLQQPLRKSAFTAQNFVFRFLSFYRAYVSRHDNNINFETTKMIMKSFNVINKTLVEQRNREIYHPVYVNSCFALFRAKYSYIFYSLCAD